MKTWYHFILNTENTLKVELQFEVVDFCTWGFVAVNK